MFTHDEIAQRTFSDILTLKLGTSEWLCIRMNVTGHKFKWVEKLISPLIPAAAFGRTSISVEAGFSPALLPEVAPVGVGKAGQGTQGSTLSSLRPPVHTGLC